jgi:glucosamine-6-phosphate deaminase
MDARQLYKWCSIPGLELAQHPGSKARFRVVRDSREMGELMARELVEVIQENNRGGRRHACHYSLRP